MKASKSLWKVSSDEILKGPVLKYEYFVREQKLSEYFVREQKLTDQPLTDLLCVWNPQIRILHSLDPDDFVTSIHGLLKCFLCLLVFI